MTDPSYSETIQRFDKQVRETGVKIEPLPARFWEDEHWLFDHIAEFTQVYPEQWVAVYNKEIVGVGDSYREAEKAAIDKVGEVGPLVIVHMEYKTYVYSTGSTHSGTS